MSSPIPSIAHEAVRTLGTVLSIWAHPDDETYLAGGVMAAARDHGQRVVCASATAGELGTNDPDNWPPDRLGCVRRREAGLAMAILGVDDHHIVGLPDGSLTAHEPAGRSWARKLIEDVLPDTILTFGPEGITHHPDHIAIHRWVTSAWRDAGGTGRLLYATRTASHVARFADLYQEWGIYMTDARPPGVAQDDLALDVHLEGPVLDRKLAALRAMGTQTAEIFDTLDPDVYRAIVADESFVAAPAIRSRSPSSPGSRRGRRA